MQKDILWKTSGLGLFLLGRCKLSEEKMFFSCGKAFQVIQCDNSYLFVTECHFFSVLQHSEVVSEAFNLTQKMVYIQPVASHLFVCLFLTERLQRKVYFCSRYPRG